MIYFDTKSDISHMERLLARFELIREIEKTIREEATVRDAQYGNLRRQFARMIPRANDICDGHSIAWYRNGRAAPMEGGLTFEGSIFDLVLDRPSDIMDIDTDIRDTINRCIGALEVKATREFRQLINPLYWLRRLLIFIIRLPYMLIEVSGFDVAKIQDHFLGKLAQLIYVILLVLFLIWLGVESIPDLISLIGSALVP